MGEESQSFGTSSTAFPGHKQRAGWEMGLPGLELVPIWDPGAFKVRTLAARPRCRVPGSFLISSSYRTMKLQETEKLCSLPSYNYGFKLWNCCRILRAYPWRKTVPLPSHGLYTSTSILLHIILLKWLLAKTNDEVITEEIIKQYLW